HIQGAKAVREVVEAAREVNIKYLTLYAFSIENWNRPQEEIDALMHLLVKNLQSETPLLQKQGIRLRVIGDIESLDPITRAELTTTLALTEQNKNMDLVLALSYGSRFEITQALKKIAEEVKANTLNIDEISVNTINSYLQTNFMPDPDLVIRTSGEHRLSNFLLWQVAYSEFYFTTILWPDFTKEAFFEAVIHYQQRERRFGKTSAQISSKN
ncbi:MAG: polyprenyl diphosphate synthase, partial [Bacteroidales bacterium]